MISLMSGVLQSGENVLSLEIGVVPQDLVVRCPEAEQLQNIADSNAEASDARPPTTFAGFNGDALEM